MKFHPIEFYDTAKAEKHRGTINESESGSGEKHFRAFCLCGWKCGTFNLLADRFYYRYEVIEILLKHYRNGGTK